MAVQLTESRLFAAHPWCASGFSRRDGGVSVGAFASLNLGLHVGDDREAVLENRERAAESLGFGLADMVCAAQVHGGDVAVVDGSSRGRGATVIDDAVPGVDALITDAPNVLLTLFFADCIPVLLADTKKRIVGVVHAGWRGVVSEMVETTVEAMIARFGANAEDIVAAIGPGIGACCFEVGEDVARRFPSTFVGYSGAFARPHVDLKAAIESRLLGVGVRPGSIDDAGECTACNSEAYFSYRRDSANTGRTAAMIGLRRNEDLQRRDREL